MCNMCSRGLSSHILIYIIPAIMTISETYDMWNEAVIKFNITRPFLRILPLMIDELIYHDFPYMWSPIWAIGPCRLVVFNHVYFSHLKITPYTYWCICKYSREVLSFYVEMSKKSGKNIVPKNFTVFIRLRVHTYLDSLWKKTDVWKFHEKAWNMLTLGFISFYDAWIQFLAEKWPSGIKVVHPP